MALISFGSNVCLQSSSLRSFTHRKARQSRRPPGTHKHTHTNATAAAARLSCPISSDCTGALGRQAIHPVLSRPDRGRNISAAAVWLLPVCVDVAPSQLRAAGLEMQIVTAGVPPGAGSETTDASLPVDVVNFSIFSTRKRFGCCYTREEKRINTSRSRPADCP